VVIAVTSKAIKNPGGKVSCTQAWRRLGLTPRHLCIFLVGFLLRMAAACSLLGTLSKDSMSEWYIIYRAPILFAGSSQRFRCFVMFSLPIFSSVGGSVPRSLSYLAAITDMDA